MSTGYKTQVVDKEPTVWLVWTTLGPDVEVGISAKGAIGFKIRGKHQRFLGADVYNAILDNPDTMREITVLSEAVRAENKPQVDDSKLREQMLRQAAILETKSKQLAQAGIDLQTLFKTKKQA